MPLALRVRSAFAAPWAVCVVNKVGDTGRGGVRFNGFAAAVRVSVTLRGGVRFNAFAAAWAVRVDDTALVNKGGDTGRRCILGGVQSSLDRESLGGVACRGDASPDATTL